MEVLADALLDAGCLEENLGVVRDGNNGMNRRISNWAIMGLLRNTRSRGGVMFERFGNLDGVEADFYDSQMYSTAASARHLAADLLLYVRHLKHEIANPVYSYAGGRISRNAILCRDEEIIALRNRIAQLEEGK